MYPDLTRVAELLTEGVRDWVEAAYTVEKDIDKLGDLMIERIEEREICYSESE